MCDKNIFFTTEYFSDNLIKPVEPAFCLYSLIIFHFMLLTPHGVESQTPVFTGKCVRESYYQIKVVKSKN